MGQDNVIRIGDYEGPPRIPPPEPPPPSPPRNKKRWWRRDPLVFVMQVAGILLVVGAIAVVVSLASHCEGVHCKAPVDWNPTADCRKHGGVQSMTSDGGAIDGAVCRDGVAVVNPYR